ncbi:MAG: pilus assembly protein [Thermomicrobiales bacterium]|nr:MAG: pilus assembly protein [Thermomicrobiales bacterium]
MISNLDIPVRLRAGAIHLVVSCLVALLAAALVFFLWYPGEYRNLSGGRNLFFLVTAVDVVIGPLLTVMVFDMNKGWHHLRRDLAIIALLQFGALGYGMHTVYVVRPVALVFERDRFRVISAADVYMKELETADPQYRKLPLTGPWTLGTRATASAERTETIFLSLEGYDVGQRPSFWQPYELSQADAKARAKSVSVLSARYVARKAEFEAILDSLALKRDSAFFLPLMARVDAVVLLDESGRVAGFAPFDGFF